MPTSCSSGCRRSWATSWSARCRTTSRRPKRRLSRNGLRVAELNKRLAAIGSRDAKNLLASSDYLIRKSVWSFGGDGWAYDIGFGGLDHVFASGRDVNILVLDTEVYSNTGGQASKSTFRGAVAKFAAGGKPGCKKDLGMIAMSYGNVFVGSISMGANPMHAIRTIRAAESYRGTSLLIAFSHCISWGIDMQQGMSIQKDAVACGYWPLYSFDPREEAHPFQLASKKPVGAVQGVRHEGGAVRHVGALEAGRFGPAVGLASGTSTSGIISTSSWPAWTGRRLSRRRRRKLAATATPRRRTRRRWKHERRPEHDLSWLETEEPAGDFGLPVDAATDQLRRLEQAGAAAAVLPSLFEEQIEHDAEEMAKVHEFHTESFAESLTYFPEEEDYPAGPEEYLETIAEAKKAVRMPIIASLNGASKGGWVRYAKMMQDAGADALELNIYFVAADLDTTSRDVESRYLELVATVKQSISIPLAVKVGPYFSSHGQHGDAAGRGGRRRAGDVQSLLSSRTSIWTRWKPAEASVEFVFGAIVAAAMDRHLARPDRGVDGGHGRNPRCVRLLKVLLAGADVGMIASVLYQKGIGQIGKILTGVRQWMEENDYESVEQLKGSMSRENCPDPSAFQRGNYMKTLTSYVGKAI